MIYNSLRYKYTYQKITSHTTRIFECLSNNIQLRYSQSIPINDDMNTIIFNHASLHREFHLGNGQGKGAQGPQPRQVLRLGFLESLKDCEGFKRPGFAMNVPFGGVKV